MSEIAKDLAWGLSAVCMLVLFAAGMNWLMVHHLIATAMVVLVPLAMYGVFCIGGMVREVWRAYR